MEAHLYKAFPRGNKGGNAAGIVLLDDFSDDARMQMVAKEIGFSETAFGTALSAQTFKLRFFTPKTEVPLCGHATIAFLNHLRQKGIVAEGPVLLETKAGSFRAVVKKDSACIEIAAPLIGEEVAAGAAFHALGIAKDEKGPIPATVIQTGIKEIFVEVKDRRILASLAPAEERIETFCQKFGVDGVYVFARDPLEKTAIASGRNFLPAIGIPEESATGTASVSLAALLHDRGVKCGIYRFEQGDFMGEPSWVEVSLASDAEERIRSALLCGTAIQTTKRTFSF